MYVCMYVCSICRDTRKVDAVKHRMKVLNKMMNWQNKEEHADFVKSPTGRGLDKQLKIWSWKRDGLSPDQHSGTSNCCREKWTCYGAVENRTRSNYAQHIKLFILPFCLDFHSEGWYLSLVCNSTASHKILRNCCWCYGESLLSFPLLN